MNPRGTLIRVKKFQVDEKRRKVMRIEGMLATLESMADQLEREVKAEQHHAGIHDPSHFAYPTYAKAAAQRRENLKRSADDLKNELNAAKLALTDALGELQVLELREERRQMPDPTEPRPSKPSFLQSRLRRNRVASA